MKGGWMDGWRESKLTDLPKLLPEGGVALDG